MVLLWVHQIGQKLGVTHFLSHSSQYLKDVKFIQEGDEPSDENYISVSYELVGKLIEGIITTRTANLEPDIRTTLEHYLKMLRRHILSGSEIEELSQKIYRRHQKALDIIFDHKPDLQAHIHDYLKAIIEKEVELELDVSSKSYIRFLPRDWNAPLLLEGEGWTKTGRILLFEFRNGPDSLGLHLLVGPGPDETRRKLYDLSKGDNPPLNSTYKKLYSQYHSIFVLHIIKRRDYEGASIEDLLDKIEREWSKFRTNELPNIRKIIKNQEWLWQDNK